MPTSTGIFPFHFFHHVHTTRNENHRVDRRRLSETILIPRGTSNHDRRSRSLPPLNRNGRNTIERREMRRMPWPADREGAIEVSAEKLKAARHTRGGISTGARERERESPASGWRSGGEVVGGRKRRRSSHDTQRVVTMEPISVGRWAFVTARALHARGNKCRAYVRDEPYCGAGARALASCVFIARPGNNNRLLFITPPPNARTSRSHLRRDSRPSRQPLSHRAKWPSSTRRFERRVLSKEKGGGKKAKKKEENSCRQSVAINASWEHREAAK